MDVSTPLAKILLALTVVLWTMFAVMVRVSKRRLSAFHDGRRAEPGSVD